MRTELAEHPIESGIAYDRKQLHTDVCAAPSRGGRAVTYGTAAILLTLSVLVFTAADAIPGLTIPGESTMSQIDGMRADLDLPPVGREDLYPNRSRRREAMAEIERWRLTGDWFDVCRCRVPCGCTFAQAPDEGECNGILAWRIREGNYGDVSLDGLNVVMIGSFEGNIWTGEAKDSFAGWFIDERADDSQRDALQAIFGGHAGGWPAGFANLIDEVRGIEFAPIVIEIAEDLGGWRVEVPGKAKGRAEALTGPTAPEGSRVQVHNAPGAEVGPGQVATYATATEDEVEAFGFKWSWPGRSSKHFPFDWSGPD